MSMGNATVTVGADVSQFQSGMATASGAAAQFQAAIASLQNAVGSLSSAVASVQSGMGQFADAMGVVNSSTGEAAAAIGNENGGILSAFEGMGSGADIASGKMGEFANSVLMSITPLGLFHTHMARLIEVMAGWRFMEYGIAKIREFANELTQLPVVMQQTEIAWQYTYGMSQVTNPTGNLATAQNISHQLAAWSARESYNLPFTRQDEIAAITGLSRTSLSSEGIEQYLPVLSDIASTAGMVGGQPVTLQRAAMAIQGAYMGYDRMIRYDLGIDPAWLQQYGYNSSNVATLMPALMAYTMAKHRTQWNYYDPATQKVGAAVDPTKIDPKQLAALLQNNQIIDTGAGSQMAHTTWTGAYSSWQDRYQNFLLDISGYPAYDSPDGTKAGDMRTGSPIDMAMQGLNALTTWWDKHQSNFNQMASFFSKTLGQAMADAGDGLEHFAQGLASSGVGDLIAHGFGKFSQMIGSPEFKQTVDVFTQNAGGAVGSGLNLALDGLKTAIQTLTQAFQAGGPGAGKAAANALTIPGYATGLGAIIGGGLIKGLSDVIFGPIHGFQQGYGRGGILGGVGQGLWGLLGGVGQGWGDLFMTSAQAWDLTANWTGLDWGRKHGLENWLGGIGQGTSGFFGNLNNWLGITPYWTHQDVRGSNGHWADVSQRGWTVWDWLGQQGGEAGAGLGYWGGQANNLINHLGLGQIGSSMQSTFGALPGLFGRVGNALDPVVKYFGSIYDLLTGNFLGAWQNLHTLLQDLANGPLAGVHQLFVDIGNAIKNIPFIGKYLGGSGSTRQSGTPGKKANSGTIQPGGH